MLKNFLSENRLRTTIQINDNTLYFYIKLNHEVIGTIGAEFNQHHALIRGAGIAAPFRRQGIGQLLYRKLADELKNKGIHQFYLFSRQAGEFWAAMGFKKCAIQEVIDALPDAPQVKQFLEDNSIWTDVPWKRSK